MPLGEFRVKKLIFVFNVFFDVDESGGIEKKDFDLALEKIARMRGYSATDPKYIETQNTLLRIWEGLRQKADKDQDGEISHSEWCGMWEQYAADPENALAWQKDYMNFIFDLQDTSADGTIDECEFTTVCTAYNITEGDCKEAFAKFTANNTIEITRQEFGILWKEFFTSDDQNSRGNFIFGRTKWN